ncbi:MAG: hypothetical protein HOK52_00815 [Candidatus Marinimicrobia bacterium]|jgi:1-acyl-sn-glycerol-3-phosphate acyltransferase|nr:hypothetical protein [Candidatus Neomarinimicrobiota bacterium]MBT3937482.1 hypothetical protein [Candidatus Neomarinimicrobiota bacterium]MBT3960657.1 hypothetical protein [Candidatus Neomarinimicrobiota bacterium]MBT4383180.1 hypothetical protein [Candidatus Neomarinimicrobiota bacterium]MBT4684443.1 hypothetical protein [Candidatus Neomarinimicrobiota bacterium]
MLYFLTKQLTIAAVRIFFDSITAKHIDHIPDEGPVIFVANHPNTLMDPLVIGTTCPRQLHFFAKSPLFNSWFNRTILTRLKLVPIYRKQDNPKQMDKNDQTFARGFDILENGGSFLIFPEGVSTGDRVLEKIKTGAARIGLGAEEKNNFNLNVNIIPVGLSYSNAIKFRSDILVRYGKPISLKSFKNAYSHDSIETVHQITSQIESALSKLTTNVNEIEVMDIVECLERIYKKELMVEMGFKLDSKGDDFAATRGLIDAVEWYQDHYPEKVDEFRNMLSTYLDDLNELDIQESFLGPGGESLTLRNRLKALCFMIVGFPIYMWGLIHNYIPYKLPRWIAKRSTDAKAEIAPFKMIYGLLVFVIIYGIELSLVQWLFHQWRLTIVWGLTLIPSGNFALKYIHHVREYKQHLKFLSLFYKERGQVFKLIEKRQHIIRFIDKAKELYYSENQLDSP